QGGAGADQRAGTQLRRGRDARRWRLLERQLVALAHDPERPAHVLAGVPCGVLRRGHQPVAARVKGVLAQTPAEAQLVRADLVLVAETPAQSHVAGAAVPLGLPLARLDAALAALHAARGTLDGELRHRRLRNPVLDRRADGLRRARS